MIFLILVSDRPDQLQRRLHHRPSHRAYWNALGDRLKLAGPMTTDGNPDATSKGSFFLLDADSADHARRLVADDPFTIEGIFGSDVRIEQVSPGLGAWLPGA